MNYTIKRYTSADEALWNAAVDNGGVRQASFLFNRQYMDYHADRFCDISLMVMDDHERVLALLPANVSRADEHCVESHGGLTYGGLLLSPHMTATLTGEVMQSIMAWYKAQGFTTLKYKPVPHHYADYPCEEDLYWLFRHDAQLTVRLIASVVDLAQPYALSTLRRRKVNKANRLGTLQEGEGIGFLPAYWQVLEEILHARYDARPVHTLQEMQLLMQRFPQNIRLFVATERTTNTIQAGCVLYITRHVVHVQYIAASDAGCALGALDWLFAQLLSQAAVLFPHVRYFDFGTCNEQDGRYLNEGLIFQKEGFGARAICYDTYGMEL